MTAIITRVSHIVRTRDGNLRKEGERYGFDIEERRGFGCD